MASKNGNVLSMPEVQLGYAQARVILRDLENHDHDQIDAAFEVLVYSRDESDLVLCQNTVDYLWGTVKPSSVIILTVMGIAMVALLSLAAILVEVLL